MGKRIIGWVVLVPLCVLLVLFALANRQLVVVNFNPFVPAQALTVPGFGVPLFIVLLSVLLIGVLLGGVAAWFAGGRSRRERRHWRKEAAHLTRDLEALRRQPAQHRSLLEVDELLDRP